ncbi:MAG: hypothetical protein M1493_04505 [Firmicutes bacterium]|uniref:Uncharacterized protein n=1 Tax=Sulfobacillus benefaciens TaxID=453960 RepID=A0A2T2WXP4_9FIRM|nr:hypothetical protein [Bacillota bacterium]PSR27001.1 MAG: hypothetical protein C7B43_12595 [Sulfobacillus benefaciens]
MPGNLPNSLLTISRKIQTMSLDVRQRPQCGMGLVGAEEEKGNRLSTPSFGMESGRSHGSRDKSRLVCFAGIEFLAALGC